MRSSDFEQSSAKGLTRIDTDFTDKGGFVPWRFDRFFASLIFFEAFSGGT
jgi:hypothetical protein